MEIEIRPVTGDEFEAIIPLIVAYMEFYEVTGIGEDRIREYFGPFAGDRDDAWLHAAWDGADPVGFACYYRVRNSLAAADTLLLHDLYVKEDVRGGGVGRRLIETGIGIARSFGAPQLEWSTAPDNQVAQRLYDSTGAEKSTWLTYELKVE
ncbi:MAG: GNAT family N-acetyltransferase [Solirubrobacterales bacterium]|nr:GNAT family N-acetyltransferase [Solirubrobacterales bacterium]